MTANQVTSIDRFVRDLCARVDDPDGTRSYMKLLRITTNAVEQMNLHFIPNIRSFFGTVADNGTMPVPENCIEPIHGSKYMVIGGVECVYPLGRNKESNIYELAIKPANYWACPETPEAPTFNTESYYYNYPGISDGVDGRYHYLNWWYGENYGYHEHRVFGYWSFDESGRQIVFQSGGCVAVGDTVVFSYRTSGPDDKYKMIPNDIKFFLAERVLQQYWESTDVRKASYHFNQMQRNLREYQHDKAGNYTMEDFLNAFKRGYASAAR